MRPGNTPGRSFITLDSRPPAATIMRSSPPICAIEARLSPAVRSIDILSRIVFAQNRKKSEFRAEAASAAPGDGQVSPR